MGGFGFKMSRGEPIMCGSARKRAEMSGKELKMSKVGVSGWE